MSEPSSKTKLFDSPFRLLAIVAASVFVSEALVMVLLIILPPLPHAVAAPLDAILVTVLIYPILYRFMLRPMTQHLNDRRQAEAALRQIQEDLELRVQQRTAELAQANEALKAALDVVQQRQVEMAGLLTGARAVLEYRDFTQVAQAIFEACRSTIGATAGYVALPTEDRSGEMPVFSAVRERTREPFAAKPMPMVGLRHQAYKTRKTVYTNECDNCRDAQSLPDGHFPVKNILFAPMTIKGFVVGTVVLANKPCAFSDDDARLATAFAELAAIAVLNSRTIGLLESSERRFSTLAQATFEGIVISESGIIREANEQFAAMHGYTLPEVLGKPIADFLVPQDYERLRQAIAAADKHFGEYHAQRKDGSVFLLEVQAYTTEQNGRVVRVMALRDISGRKRAEEAFRARSALLSSLIESPDSAIFSIDPEYHYTSFNRRHAGVMQALFGAEIEIGGNLLEYHTVESDRQAAKQNLDRALSGESFVIEDWAGDDALTRRCFEISHNPVKDADQIIGASVFAQDITERKYADQMLRENEEWLRLAFDAGDLGRWRYTVATGMLHFDERARLHAGSSENVVSQAEALTHIHPDDRALLQKETLQALDPAGNGRYAAEYRVWWPDGEIHWLAVQARVQFQGEDAARQPVLAVGISQDITARKQMEQALRESEERFRLALKNAPVSIAAQDRDLHFQWAYNQRTMDPSSVIGKTDKDLFPPEDAERLIALKRAVIDSNMERREQLWLTSGSQRVFLDLYLEPLRDTTGQVIGIGIATLDLTQMKLAEEALRESRRDLDRAQEVGQTGSWRLDVRRNVLTWSDENHRIFGVPAGTPLTYDTFLNSVHPDDREYVDRQWTAGLAGEPYDIEHRIIAAGAVKWVREKAYLEFDQDGALLGGFGITQDITERKRAEEQLRATLESIGDGFFACDADWRFVYVNAPAERILGIRRDEVLGKNHWDVFPLTVGTNLECEYRRAAAGEIRDFENFFEPWSRWFHNRCFPREGGGMSVYFEDITARKHTEDRVNWLATFPEFNPSPVIEVDLTGTIHYLNPAAKRLLPDLEMEGHAHPWLADLGVVGRRLQTGDTPVLAREIAHGCAIYQQIMYYVPDTQRVRIYGLDLTARKRAEDALRESEEKYRLLFENLAEGFALYELVRDADGEPVDWRVLEVNQAYSKHTGIARSIIVGKRISELFPASIPEYLPRFTRVVDEQVSIDFETFSKAGGRFQHVMTFPAGGDRFASVIEDITDRKQAEEQLRLLSTALEAAANGVVVTDLQGNILWVNPSFTALTGYTREEALGKNPRVLKSGQHRAEYYQQLWGTILRGQPWSGEIINRRKDGTLYHEEMTITPVRAEGRDITHFVAIKEDITARKQIEEALRRQAALLDLSPDAIIVRRMDGTITFWSSGAEKLYEWPEAEALGQPIGSLLHPRLPEMEEQIVEQLERTGNWSGEITHHTRSGRSVVVQSWWLAQFDAQGGITEIFESNVDFTVRKQMEEQLRLAYAGLELRVLERTAELAAANKELRLQSAALQAAANGIIITDPSGNIQWANSAFAAMTGYPLSEVLGQNIRLLKSTEQAPEFYRQLWETILAGQVWQGELINCRKDGSHYVEEQTIAPVLSESGRIINFIAVKQDISERKQAEARLTQYNQDLLALGNAERRARQMAETLAAASLALTQSLELEAVMETLLDYMYQLVPYDSANVMLLETEERLVVRAVRGYEEWTQAHVTRTITFDAHSNPILADLLSRQKSVLIPETRVHPDWDLRHGAEHVRSWMGVPIIAGGHVIGIYSLDKVIPDFFTTEHVRLAEALIGQAAIAIQNAWLFDQLRAGRERLQSLSRRLVEVQEAERHYVARELHDEAGQALTSLVYALGELERETVPDKRALRLADMKKTTHEILENLHHLAMELRPASLDFLGLVPALNQYVKATGERYKLNAQFKVIGLTEERLPNAMETALYRIVQEALTNVIRHAQATRVDVLLERRDEQVVLVMEDNGRGFAAELAQLAQTGHLGLVGMQERAEMLNGTLVIESTPDAGTTIVIEVPYDPANSDRG